jgi:hypothetical protein
VTRADDARETEDCPDCGARRGQPCIALWPRQIPRGTEPRLYSGALRARMERAGQPIKIVHNGRARALYESEIRAGDARRAAELREWFRAYGEIFREDAR